MAPWPVFVLAGILIGSLTGLFGVGGSSVATPLLSLLGVPPIIAVASPLPATIATALAGVVPYAREGEARPKAAGWSLLGAVPGTLIGAYLSDVVGGEALLIASGLVLVVIGQRVLRPIDPEMRARGTERRQNRPALVAASAVIGVLAGLLANGGGFLLVPMYLLVFGLTMRQSVGTSLLVIVVLSIPNVLVHWSLGHIDWAVAAAFALGAVPAAWVSGRLAHRVAGPQVRRAFGWFLVVSGVVFVAIRLLGMR
jgi:uncharacterized membrane protein YfcA